MSKLSPIESSQQLWDLLDELEVVCFSNRTESLELSFPWINVPSVRKGSVRDSKIMFCHDMMGGYLEDSFLEGGESFHVYNFTLWHYIDIFIYFSHHFITLPPYGWIKAAHIHGVPVLGTIITEWEQGEKENIKLLEEYEEPKEFNFHSKKYQFKFKSSLPLVLLAFVMNFDGWFINIEAKMTKELAVKMQEFVLELKNAIHVFIDSPFAQVIWYDSVTKDGDLSWQDSLNENNQVYFDNSDGIFTNYFWKDEKLDECVRNARNRITDVYVGVDVFGRSKEQTGELDSDIPCRKAINAKLSVGLFAPGWAFEKSTTREEYIELQESLWVSSLTKGIGSIIPPRKLPSPEKVFTTYFNDGIGHFIFENGDIIETKDWNNLMKQDILPLQYLNCIKGDNTNWNLSFNHAQGFKGGSSLQITSKNNSEDSYSSFLLYEFIEGNFKPDKLSISYFNSGIDIIFSVGNNHSTLFFSEDKSINFIKETSEDNIIFPNLIECKNEWKVCSFEFPSPIEVLSIKIHCKQRNRNENEYCLLGQLILT